MSFLTDYMLYASNTEAPANYNLACGLATLSACASRRISIAQGRFLFHPCVYIVLVGPAGGKKSSAMYEAESIIRDVKDIPMSAESTTKEALIKELESTNRKFPISATEVIEYCPLVICVSELSEFVGPSQVGMTSLLTDLYDRNFYAYKTKGRGDNFLIGPALTLLGCTTPEWITARLKDDVITGGFSRRTLFVYEFEEGPRIAFPELNDEQRAARSRLIAHCCKIKELAGEFKWETSARRFYADWYENRVIPRDYIVHGYHNAKQNHVLKLAMLCALSEETVLVMRQEYVKTALDILERFETNLAKVFEGIGRNELNAVASRVMEHLGNRNGYMREKELKALMFPHCNGEDFAKVIYHLIDTGKLERFKVEGDERVYLGLTSRLPPATSQPQPPAPSPVPEP